MVRVAKSSALILIFLFAMPFISQQIAVLAQSSNSTAPAIEWQKEYRNYDTESVSNLIQTTDGGYAFLDLGWSHGLSPLKPSTLYKTDSSGNVQWNKTIYWFTAISVIQTSDNGFEVSGKWNTYGTPFERNPTPTLIKTDSAGNIEWVQNYTSVLQNLNISSSKILTNNGGVISLQSSGSIIKTDSNGTAQWQINGTFTYYGFKTPLIHLTSLIQTSDGSIAALGIGTPYSRPMWQGNIYLIKTEPFLPLPSPTQLPTPISTPIEGISQSSLIFVIVFLVFITIIIVSMLIYRKHRKTASKLKA